MNNSPNLSVSWHNSVESLTVELKLDIFYREENKFWTEWFANSKVVWLVGCKCYLTLMSIIFGKPTMQAPHVDRNKGVATECTGLMPGSISHFVYATWQHDAFDRHFRGWSLHIGNIAEANGLLDVAMCGWGRGCGWKQQIPSCKDTWHAPDGSEALTNIHHKLDLLVEDLSLHQWRMCWDQNRLMSGSLKVRRRG